MQLAEKYAGHAKTLMPSPDPSDVFAAISLLDAALKLCPQWEKALELKARALLSLRRFRDVVNMLHEYVPSAKSLTEKASPPDSPLFGKDKVQLLSNFVEERSKKKSLLKYLAVNKIKKILITGLARRNERNEWRYLVLGQACCHLGMMEDAMILLQNGKKVACAAFRRESISLGEDAFCSDAFAGPDSDFVSHLLGNIKFLIRRRAAALAAMEAGLYPEAVRHFSKILDGRRGTPQGFLAECYLYRALAHKANGKIPDAIADCNRTLCLDPTCVQALSVRAALYEMIRCFYESLQDLKQLKCLYDALAQQQRFPGTAWRFPHNSDYEDISGSLYQLDVKLSAVKQRLENRYTIDYHTILGLTSKCTKAEVERAHLLICLKHRPDKAAHFIDRCEFVDERDPEVVKEEARLAATRLFRLIQNAHSGVMHMLLEDGEKRKRAHRCLQEASEAGPSVTIHPVEEKEREKVDTNASLQFITLSDAAHDQQQQNLAAAAAPLFCHRTSSQEDLLLGASLRTEDSSHTPDLEFRPRVEASEQQLLDITSEPPAAAHSIGPPPSATLLDESVTASEASRATDSCTAAEPSPTMPDDSNKETDAGSPSPLSYHEVVAVESKLALVLSPSNWLNSGDANSWSFRNHHPPMALPMPLQVT